MLLLTLMAAPLPAQSSTWWLDMAGTAVQQPNSTMRPAATLGIGGLRSGLLGPAGDRRGAWSVTADAALTLARDSVDATQGVIRASITPSRLPWSTTDVEGSATTIGIAVPGGNGAQSVAVQQSVQRGALRLHGGAGLGRASRYGLDSRGTTITAGLSGSRGPLAGALTLQRATTNDWQLMEASGFVLTRSAGAYALRDVRAELSWRASALQLSASGSRRVGLGATSGTVSGFAGAAAWQLHPLVQVVAHAGRQLADPLRGVPQADYVGMVARWQRRRPAALTAAHVETRSVRNAEATLVLRSGGAELLVHVNAPANAVVEIASSVNEWTPARASREGDRFVARLSLPGGTHRVAIRVNGGSWRAPRGLVRVDDEFGGAAGIVVVP